MNCPKCRLESPPDASRCDCGWDFATQSQAASLLPAQAASAQMPSHPLVRRGRALALGGLAAMVGFGSVGRLLGESPFGLFLGAVGDVGAFVLFAGLATWAVGALRSRRTSSAT